MKRGGNVITTVPYRRICIPVTVSYLQVYIEIYLNKLRKTTKTVSKNLLRAFNSISLFHMEGLSYGKEQSMYS